MATYTISGTLTPDATGTTGEPAGVFNGQNYWTWTTEGTAWYLAYNGPRYVIRNTLGAGATGLWISDTIGIDPSGTYIPLINVTGTATVALAPMYMAFEISDGPDAGKFIALEMT